MGPGHNSITPEFLSPPATTPFIWTRRWGLSLVALGCMIRAVVGGAGVAARAERLPPLPTAAAGQA